MMASPGSTRPSLGSIVLAALVACFLGRGAEGTVPNAPSGPEPRGESGSDSDPTELVDRLSRSEGLEQDALLFELRSTGAEGLEATRRALARTAADTAGRRALERAELALLEDSLVPVLRTALESQLSFDGQYRDLKKLEDSGVRALIAIVEDSAREFALRHAACRALADTASASWRSEFRRLYHDILLPQPLREQMGILLAIFGDTIAIEREIKEYRKFVESEDPRLKLSALLQLSNLSYRIRDYAEAVKSYESIIETFEMLVARQPNPGFRASLEKDLALHYYNAACSASLGGEIDKARRFLEKAVRLTPLHYDNIEKDGDLENLREAAGYEEFRRQLGKVFEEEDV